jgi:hypothetical protein
VDIPGGSSQSFVRAFTPTAAFPPTEVRLAFQCDNAASATIVSGVNTVFLTASSVPAPDVIALPAVQCCETNVLTIPVPPGSQLFSVATANIGDGDRITASADTGNQPLPLTLTLCPNDAAARCLAPMASSVAVDMPSGATTSFIIMATASGPIPFDPASNRVFIRFVDSDGILRGMTSVAVQSPATFLAF